MQGEREEEKREEGESKRDGEVHIHAKKGRISIRREMVEVCIVVHDRLNTSRDC
eukprot:SAG31_NODE_10700_length_1108_cov_1.330030_1_plen_53_part_01